MRDFGLQPGNKIVLQVEREDFIPVFWSCILGGFLPIPISIPPSYSESNKVLTKLHDVWKLLNHPPILTTEALAPQIQAALEQHGTKVQTPTVETIETYPADTQWYPSQPDNPIYFLLTSGTTGKPKLITHTHRSVVSRFFPPKQNKSLKDEEKIDFRWLPFEHMGGLRIVVPNVYCQIHLSTTAFLQKPFLWFDIIHKYRVTQAVILNFALRLLIDEIDREPQHPCNLSSLRQIMIAGEPIVAQTARTFLQRLADWGLSDDVLYPAYGMSETGEITISQDFSLDNTSNEDSFVVVGQPTPRHSIRIVDSQGHLLQEGEIGSIEVCGPTISVGYYQSPEKNRTAFTEDGWFRTGDLGFLQDGSLTVTGRKKEIIIINGLNYHSHQFEKVVTEIEGVTPTYTVACGVRQPSSDTDELAIFFNTSILEPNCLSQLLRKIRRTVVRQLGVNSTYLIPVEKSVIPKTGTGKIQRLQLKQRFERGEFEAIHKQVEELLDREFVAPRTESEKALAAIWTELLGVEVGVNDDFFELGGHSLLVPQVILRLQQAFKVELSLRTLFESPTLAQLDKTLKELSQNSPKQPFVTTETGTYKQPWWGVENEYPLSPELELYWIGSQLSSANTFSPKFSIQNRSTWKCEFDPVLLQRACDLVVKRNEILRTCLIRKGSNVLKLLSKLLPNSLVNQRSPSLLKHLEQAIITLLGKPNSIAAKLIHRLISFKINLELNLVRQKILPPQPVQLNYYNYESVGNENALEKMVEEIATSEVQRPFDMNHGPLLRCAFIKNPNETLTVLVTVHHGFVDLTGVKQVAEELYRVYQALKRNELNSLEIPPQYGDYSIRWASLKNSSSYRADIYFWQKQFAYCNPIVIPPQPSAECRENFQSSEPIDREIGELINSYCQEIRVPTSAFFLAAYYLLLHQITKGTNLYAIVNNGTRPDIDSEATIGTFLQLFPLTVNLKQSHTITQLIRASAHNIFALIEHRRVSLPRLVSHDIYIAGAMMKQPPCVFQVIQTTEKPLQNRRTPSYLIDAPDWRFDILIHGTSKYSLRVGYNMVFYGHEYVESLVNQYQQILTNMATNPQQDIIQIKQKA